MSLAMMRRNRERSGLSETASQPIHLFLQSQLFQFQPRHQGRVRSRSLILDGDLSVDPAMAGFETFEPGLKIHEASASSDANQAHARKVGRHETVIPRGL